MQSRSGDKRLRKYLAVNLKKERAAKGWTQELLAEKSGLSLVFVNRVENCAQAISIDGIQRLGDALGIDAAALLKPVKAEGN